MVPPARNQIAIEPAIEAKPRKKQTLLSNLSGFDFIQLHYHRSFFNQGVKFGIFHFIPRAGQRKQLIDCQEFAFWVDVHGQEKERFEGRGKGEFG